MQTIADELGISKVSVSKALNNQPGVSKKLKESIFQKARETGYDMKSRKEGEKKISRLGLLVSDRYYFENEQFYTKIHLFLLQECTRKKIGLYLHVLNHEKAVDEDLLPFLRENSFDGLCLTGWLDDKYLRVLVRQPLPMVAIDFYKVNMPIDSIVIDNYYASFLATNHLIENGHTQIGFLGNHKSTSSVSDRFYGYLKALDQNDLEYREEWHIAENYESGMFTHRFSLPDPLPTSFVCHCDSAAFQLMLLLQGQGIRVPKDVSLIAFDNTDSSIRSNPQITTINIDKKELAIKGLEQLLWRINNTLAEPQRVELNTHLIERQTVKPFK
jgi:LacI family transcriptional regulator